MSYVANALAARLDDLWGDRVLRVEDDRLLLLKYCLSSPMQGLDLQWEVGDEPITLNRRFLNRLMKRVLAI